MAWNTDKIQKYKSSSNTLTQPDNEWNTDKLNLYRETGTARIQNQSTYNEPVIVERQDEDEEYYREGLENFDIRRTERWIRINKEKSAKKLQEEQDKKPTALKFVENLGSQMKKTIFGADLQRDVQDKHKTNMTTGSKALDVASNIGGTLLGYAMPVPGAQGGSLISATNDIAKPVTQRIASKVGNKTIGRIAEGAVEGAITGAPMGLYAGLTENLTPKETAKRIAQDTVFGAIGGAAIQGIGEGFTALRKVLKTPAADLAKSTEVVHINPIVKPATKPGAFKLKNTELDNAWDEYNTAIKTIQDHFGTNQLRADEVSQIKPILGIDLDNIMGRIEEASKKAIPSAEDASMRRVAGLGSDKNYKLINNLKNVPEPSQTSINSGIDAVKSPLKTPALKNSSIGDDLVKPQNYEQVQSNIDRLKSAKEQFVKRLDELSNMLPEEVDNLSQTGREFRERTINELKTHVESIDDKIKVNLQLFAESEPDSQKIMEVMNSNVDSLLTNSDKWKDKMPLQLQRETWDRNIIDIAGKKDGELVKKYLFEPIHRNEAERQKFLNSGRDLIKKLNLSKTESELVQKLGEGKIDIRAIPGNVNPEKIKTAVKTFRNWYNSALDSANEALVRNGYAPVPKRTDYFPHFEGDDPLMRALGIKLDLVDLPTDINGLTHRFKPSKNFFGNFLKREGDNTTYDAVQGFDRYIEGISRVIHHTDDIKRLRKFNKDLRLKYSPKEISLQVDDIFKSDLPQEAKDAAIEELLGRSKTHLSNAVADIEEYTNVLAGKKDLADRASERRFGRQVYNIANTIQNRIGKNMVAINPGSWITNFIPVTQSLATTDKTSVVKAMSDTMKNINKNDGFINNSTFLTNRIGSDILDKSITDKAGDALSAPFKWIDNFTSQVVTRSKYLEGLKQGLNPEKAMKKADDWAAKIMGDRSLGAQPTLFNQKDPVVRLFTQFQLEVNNQLSFMLKDLPREYLNDGATLKNTARLSSAIGQMLVYGWLYNNVYEKVTGRRAALDPIGIALGFKKDLEEGNKSQAVFNLGKETVQQVPFVGGVLGGGRLPISTPVKSLFVDAPTDIVKTATGDMDTKTGLKSIAKDIGTAAAYVVPPFGGGQLKKTLEGVGAVNAGGEYSTNDKGEKALKYPINNNPSNYLSGALFGKGALKETKQFYSGNNRALSTSQTEKLQEAEKLGVPIDKTYEQIMRWREQDKMIKEANDPKKKEAGRMDKIKDVTSNPNLSEKQKSVLKKLLIN